ncbi:Opsin-3 Encephalopsin [Takifugu flavidus]|uniref:Opsin-3 Encephalopsin n=1 Tax=Takifugu flavidus TaxID=433684 RepID=A0A5C6MQX5_9TELE|nr:Opsin-3 Encephalopsin [Takifugu flavidus]
MVLQTRECNFSTPDTSVRGPWAPQGPGGMSRTGHTVVAVMLGTILLAGVFGNSVVFLVFVKYRSLRTPINLILLNISLSDILVCVFGTPLSFAASLKGRWLLGERGCEWYGFANSLFGVSNGCVHPPPPPPLSPQ